MSLESDFNDPFRNLATTAQNQNTLTTLKGTGGPKVHTLRLSVFPREGFCASRECMEALPRKIVNVVEECLGLLEPEFQNPQLYVDCQKGHDPWIAHPTCRHPRCVDAATHIANVLGVEAPLRGDNVPCLEADTPSPTQDEAPEALTKELLHRLLAAAQLEGLPNLVDLFQEGLKDGSIKPTAPYTIKS